MADVIKGRFPESGSHIEKGEDKPVPSYVLHIALAFSDPLIWRRVQVPGRFTLAQLHDVIQAAMGWSNRHVHQFMVGKISYEPTMQRRILRESRRFDEARWQLHLLEEGMQFLFTYLYDAGEGWEHQLTLEEIVAPKYQLDHAILLSGERGCPPEEIGDIHQFQQLLSGWEQGAQEARSELLEAAGRPDYQPEDIDLDLLKKRVTLVR